MARPRSDDRQNAILVACTDLVAEQGIAAATAEIAKRAGIPHGSVFTYFPTKAALLNQVYLELKNELTVIVQEAVSAGTDTKSKLEGLWTAWIRWGIQSPVKRRALAQLAVSEQISDESRRAAYEAARSSLDLISRASAKGVLGNVPLPYVGALVEAMVSTTIDHMNRDPSHAEAVSSAGFEALWKALN